MKRLQQGMAVVLAAQLVLAVILFWPRPAAVGTGNPLLGALKADEITSLTITDDQGASIRLAKAGDQWSLPAAGDFPADKAKITPLLDKLLALTDSRLIAETAAGHAKLQVADNGFQRKVVVDGAGRQQILYFGSSAGSQTTHVRVSGQDRVYLGSNIATWEMNTGASSWVNAQYLSVPVADITAFTLTNANGKFSFAKDAQGAWSLQDGAAGEILDQAKIAAALNQASTVRLSEPLGKEEQPEYALATPLAVVTLNYKSGPESKVSTLTIGAKSETNDTYVVKSSDSVYFVRVTGFSVKDLVENTRAGFMQAPTPTPTAAP